MKEDPSAFVGSIPLNYDQGLGPVMFAGYARDMATRVAALSPSRVLETAAGTGIGTRAMRDHLSATTHITATDLNPQMLEVAATKFSADEAVTLRQADAQALPFDDATFDCVVSQFGVMFFPDKAQSYAEVLRVLKPGGTYLFNFWDRLAFNGFAALLDRLFTKTFPDNPVRFLETPFGYTFDAARKSLIEAGFDAITASVVRHEQMIESPEAFARGMMLGSPVATAIQARGVTPEPLIAQAAQLLRAEFGETPCKTTLQAIVMSAKRLG